MSTRRSRLDSIARSQGWTHRWKHKSKNPYLKWQSDEEATNLSTFTDEDEKFRTLSTEEVIELDEQH